MSHWMLEQLDRLIDRGATPEAVALQVIAHVLDDRLAELLDFLRDESRAKSKAASYAAGLAPSTDAPPAKKP